MRPFRLILAAGLLALSSSVLQAQNGTPLLPRGNYSLVADSGYAGPDLSGFVATFADDNTMTVVAPDGSLVVRSKLTFENDTVTLNDQDGSNVCPYAAKYKVSGDLTTFKLTVIEDGCSDRSAIVGGLKWVRLDK